MELVLLRQDKTIQWKAIIGLLVSQLIVSLLLGLARAKGTFTIGNSLIYEIAGAVVFEFFISILFYAVALFLTRNWTGSVWRRDSFIAGVYGVGVILSVLFNYSLLNLNVTIVCMLWVIAFFTVLCVQYFSRFIENKLVVYFTSVFFFGWIGVYVRNLYTFNPFLNSSISWIPSSSFFVESFGTFFIALWVLSILKVRFVFERNPEIREVREIIEAQEKNYVSRKDIYAQLRDRVTIPSGKVAKLFTQIPDPSYKEETTKLNLFLSIVMMVSALNATYLLLSPVRSLVPFDGVPFILVYGGTILFFLIKMMLPYGVVTFKPLAYWFVILIAFFANMLLLYKFYYTLKYLNRFGGVIDFQKTGVMLIQFMGNLVFAVIAYRILRKLFPNYKIFSLKKDDNGEYEL